MGAGGHERAAAILALLRWQMARGYCAMKHDHSPYPIVRHPALPLKLRDAMRKQLARDERYGRLRVLLARLLEYDVFIVCILGALIVLIFWVTK